MMNPVNKVNGFIKHQITIVAACLLLFAAGAQASSPNLLIETAVEELSVALDGRKAELTEDRQALYAVINKILLPRFDRKFAAQLVLARHWRTATDEQKTRFIDAFYSNLLTRYADGVLEFDQSQIEILPFRGDDSKQRTEVRTIVRLDNGSKVPVDYDLVRRGDEWLMFNVTIEGVSYIRNFRAEVDSEIKQTSLDAVIERLEKDAGKSHTSGE
jgi:phospholipid transport system substrate-binding protein